MEVGGGVGVSKIVSDLSERGAESHSSLHWALPLDTMVWGMKLILILPSIDYGEGGQNHIEIAFSNSQARL